MFARTSSFAHPLAARSMAKVLPPTMRIGGTRFSHEVANSVYSDSRGVGFLDINAVDVGTSLLAKDFRGDDVKLHVVVEDNSVKKAQNSDLAMQEIEEAIAQVANHQAVWDHFGNPQNVGSLDETSTDVGFAIAGQASRGGVIEVGVLVQDGIIQDSKFKAVGCDSTVACGSYATEAIIGRTLAEAESLTSAAISSELELEPSKIHCSVLTRDAVRAAIASYREKHEAVHNHFTNPHNIGSLDKNSSDVGAALVGKASRGGIMNLQVQVGDGIIKDAKFKAVGCSSTVACGSYATQAIIGQTLAQAESLSSVAISSHLELRLSEVRCAALARDAVRAAIASYKKKHEAVHDHFADPVNLGSLDEDAEEVPYDVGVAVVGHASRGGVIKMQVLVEEDVIEDAVFKAVGCNSVVACGSFATTMVIGMLLPEIDDLTSESIASALRLPGSKLHCADLAEEAVRAAVENYQSKQQVL
jgi:nitrogen fixation NifU-like protein